MVQLAHIIYPVKIPVKESNESHIVSQEEKLIPIANIFYSSPLDHEGQRPPKRKSEVFFLLHVSTSNPQFLELPQSED